MQKEIKILFLFIIIFLLFYFLPTESVLFNQAIFSGLILLHEYTRQHFLTCLLPAFFIAGAIAILIKKDLIIKYLGHRTKKYISYSIASVSGMVLAVCSCTILPLFAGIKKRGAGLGPAITFLFSGPAINIAAIFLTLSVLGLDIGIARIISAIIIAILVGLTMQLLFNEQTENKPLFIEQSINNSTNKKSGAILFISLISILIVNGLQIDKYIKLSLIGLLIIIIILIAIFLLKKETSLAWLKETWGFAKVLLPVLFIGVFVAGFIMPFLPQTLIEKTVGHNSILGNLIASIFGAFMYFSTLTEVPIIHALTAKGMHQGPALALLLAGPSLSLPNMLVIRKVLGNKKTIIYISLVITYSSIAGLIFGKFF